MPLETWFPLAIYFEDLDEASTHRDAMAAAARELARAHGRRNTNLEAAWTGDVNGVQVLHEDPRFAWITAQVERHCVRYLRALGYHLEHMALYFQRSWPIISAPGQRVYRHSHPNADLSAVYYVVAPPEGGTLKLFDRAEHNAFSDGLLGASTELLSANPLTYGSVSYEPKAGRLLLFPSKTPHAVTTNAAEGERISLSFDIALTMRPAETNPVHEFLRPAPERWTPFSPKAAEGPSASAGEHEVSQGD